MWRVLAALVIAFALAPTPVAQSGYTFTRIADTAHDDVGLDSAQCVGLNDLGTVIVKFPPAGAPAYELWRGNGQSFTQVATNLHGNCPSTNDLDEIAYAAFDPSTFESVLVRNSNGTLTTLASSHSPPYLDPSVGSQVTSLSSAGSALFSSRFAAGFGGPGIHVGPVGPTIYEASVDFPLTSFLVGTMNDSLTAVFKGGRDDAGVPRAGIYRGLPVTRLIEDGDVRPGGLVTIGFAPPVINNSGTVALVASIGGGPDTVYSTSDGVSLTPVGTDPNGFIAINDAGVVAFVRNSGGVVGIYTGRPGSLDEKIIGAGDPIDGSTLVNAALWSEAINDTGAVAFVAFLADGRYGVYRADPPSNAAPLAQDGSFDTFEDTPVSGEVSASDAEGDSLSYAIVSNGSFGSAVITDPATGAFTYTPNPDVNGPDEFTFVANDGGRDSNIARITVNVAAVDDPPVASDSLLTTAEDTAATGTLSATDVDGPALTFAVVTNGTKGTATITNAATGAFTYTPNPNANGADTFTFKVNDATLDSNVATVTVTIAPVGDVSISYSVLNFGGLTVGTSTNQPGFSLGSGPYEGLGAGDLDGDGDVDLVAGNRFQATITVGLNNGSGQFVAQPSVAVGNLPNGQIVVSDFDGDGDRDVAVANQISGTVTVLINNGSGGLGSAATYANYPSAFSLAAGDLNGDGHTDLVVASSSARPPLLGMGNGTFTPGSGAIALGVSGPSLADVNNDGKLDVTNGPLVYLGNGDGTFGPSTGTGLTTLWSAVGDFDGDGKKDVLGSNRDGVATPVQLARGNGNGTFQAPLAFSHQRSSWAVAAADLNGDGRSDAVATTDIAGAISVFLGSLTTGLESHIRYGNYNAPAPPAIADFTGDGILDLAGGGNFLRGKGDGTFVASQLVIVSNNGSQNVSVGPLDVQGPDAASFSAGLICQSPLTPGGPCRIAVNFHPTTAGVKTALLEITTSDGPLTVTLNGDGIVPAPAAVPDSYTVAEDSVLDVAAPGVRGNDTNATGGSLSAVQVAGPSNGALTLNANGSFTYTPAPNFNGSDSFTYEITGGAADSNVATVSLTVSPVNDAPVAQADSYSTAEDTPLTVNSPGVLSNDTDVDSSSLTAVLVSGPAHGVVTLNAGGSFTYTPSANYSGSDSFSYKANDGAADSGVATVTLTISLGNDAPIAANASLTTNEDTTFTGVLSAVDPDGDPLTFVRVTGGTKGRVTITNASTGAFSYTPFINANGNDSFTFKATDGALDSNAATVTVTINSANDAPMAFGQSAFVQKGTTQNLFLEAADPDNDTLTYTVVDGPSHGTLSGTPPNVTYSADPAYIGSDAFTFRASDGVLDSNLATARITVSASVWTSSGPEGGRINAIAVDPANPSVVYAATESSGVFRSVNRGGRWSRGGAEVRSMNLTALAIHPASAGTLYVSSTGTGIYRSTDAGESWAARNTGLTSLWVQALAIDGASGSTLYAGTVAGVFKSTDDGASWTAINAGLTSLNVQAIAIDPGAPTTLYAGTPGGVFKSVNGGSSWTAASTGLTNLSVSGLAIDPATPTTLYAATSSSLFKSTNGGASWAASNTGLTNLFVRALAIDPTTPTTLYAGISVGGVYKTLNGGASWTAINTGGVVNGFNRGLAIDPSAPATVYAATSVGVFKTSNGGAGWTASNAGLINTFVPAVAIAPAAPATLYGGVGGTSVEGGVAKSTDGGASWATANTGVGFQIFALAVEPLAPSTLYAGNVAGVFKSTDGGGKWTLVNTGLTSSSYFCLVIDPTTPTTVYVGSQGGVFKSTNGGASWAASNTGLTNLRVVALAIDPTIPTTLYAGTFSGVFKSTNGGASWLNQGLSTPNALAIDPANSSVVYAGTAGGLFKTTDAGSTWTPANTGLTNRDIRALAIDPRNSTTIYAGTFGGGVFRSRDAGATWTPMNDGLASLRVFALAIDPSRPKALHAGTEGGVFDFHPSDGPPVSAPDSATTPEDVPVQVAVLVNDTDPDGDGLAVTDVTQGTHGVVTIAPNGGSVTYTPAADFNGNDTFTYTVSDGYDGTEVGSVTVTITPVNDAPVASDSLLTTAEDTAATGTLSATDVDGPALTFTIVTNGTKGTATITDATTGAFTYTPNANANGTDTFTFKANDGALDSNVATVTITMTPVNDPPVASNGSASVAAGAAGVGTLVATDVDGPALTYTIVANGTMGTAVVTDPATGAYTYTAGPSGGSDTFTFMASDGSLSSNVATIGITITGGNQLPVASNGTLTTQEDRSANGTVQATDPEAARLTFSIVANGTKGTATITNASTGRYAYVPAPDANGADAFTFRATDGLSNSNVGTVSVTITPVNDAPVAVDAAVTTPRNQPVSDQLQAVDADGNPLTFTLARSPRRGSVTIAANGSFTYTPNANYTGRDSFTFRVSDGATTATGTVDVTITP